MGNKRIPISKKQRFEVFKRDNFTCQYCGRMAPDVVLEINHINPISNNGNNDILNLITSCFDCNRGKGKRKLSENEEIKKQQEQLKLLNEKRNQLKMMIDWKKELENIENEQVDEIENMFIECETSFTNEGRNKIKNMINKYGFNEVYESSKVSIEQYYDENNKESIFKAFNYIIKICINRQKQQENPLLYRINYLLKIAENRFNYYDKLKLRIYLNKHLQEKDFDFIKDIFKEVKNWTQLREMLEDYYGDTL